MPLQFWGEAINTAVHVLNQVSSRTLMVILRIPSGMELNPMSAIFEFLEVCAMHIYPNLFGANLTAKHVSVFLWDIV